MKKARLIAGMTAAIPAATGFAVPAAAHAQPTAPEVARTVKTVQPQVQVDTGARWAPLSASEILYSPNGKNIASLVVGYSVYITCYYSGAPYKADKYWDHVTKISYEGNPSNNVTGHVADLHVSLPNHEFPAAAGIPHCG